VDPVEQLVAGLDPPLRRRLELIEKALHIPVIVGQHGDGIHVGRSSQWWVVDMSASLTAGSGGSYNDGHHKIAAA
jgi:hypothetical protein